MEKILVVIPAFNEEKNIPYVVRDLLTHIPTATILVINDGSSDNTSAVAKSSGALVVSLPVNLGIGGAVQTGFQYGLANGFDIAIQVDGDGQHKSSEILKLIQPILRSKVDVSIGSRFLAKTSYKAPLARRMGMVILSRIIKTVSRTRVTDPTSGFRAYNRRALTVLANHYSTDYPEPDAIVTLARNGLKIAEVSVEMEPRLSGKSSITPIKSSYYMFKVSLAIILNSLMGRVWGEES